MLYFSGTVTSGYISSVWVYPWNDKSKYQAKMTLYGQINMFFILKNMFAGMKNLITKYQGFFSSRTISPVVCLLDKCIFGFPN